METQGQTPAGQPGLMVPLLENQAQKVRVLHEQDLAEGQRRGLPALRAGAQVPERGEGTWLAIFFPVTKPFHRPVERRGAAAPRGSDGGESGDQGGGAARRFDEGSERAQFPP